MKSFSVFFLAVLYIFIESVSEVKCELPTNNLCEENSQCESGICSYISNVGKKFCVENGTSDHASGILKVEHGQCTYLKQDHVDAASQEVLVQTFTQFHAAHALIPTGTKIIVTRGNRTVTVVVDSRIPSKGMSSSSLELSDEAANALDIWNETTVPCDLQIQTDTNASSFVTYVVKPVAVVVVYLAAVVMSSYW